MYSITKLERTLSWCILKNPRRHINKPPRYNWNIVESGIKHHKP